MVADNPMTYEDPFEELLCITPVSISAALEGIHILQHVGPPSITNATHLFGVSLFKEGDTINTLPLSLHSSRYLSIGVQICDVLQSFHTFLLNRDVVFYPQVIKHIIQDTHGVTTISTHFYKQFTTKTLIN